jgi:hypothetical protein
VAPDLLRYDILNGHPIFRTNNPKIGPAGRARFDQSASADESA